MLRTVSAFSAGVVVGWVGRGVIGSERELLIRTIGVAQLVKTKVSQIAAEQVEWWEDLVAEAKARIDLRREALQPDQDAHAKVFRVA
jgi:hypothetical protein